MARILRAASAVSLLLARPLQGQEFLERKVDGETMPQSPSESTATNETLTVMSQGAAQYFPYEEAKTAVEGGAIDGWAHTSMLSPGCTLGEYWCLQFREAGIAEHKQALISAADGQWYYDGHATGIGCGGYDQICDYLNFHCAGGTTFGYGIDQAKYIKDYIDLQ